MDEHYEQIWLKAFCDSVERLQDRSDVIAGELEQLNDETDNVANLVLVADDVRHGYRPVAALLSALEDL